MAASRRVGGDQLFLDCGALLKSNALHQSFTSERTTNPTAPERRTTDSLMGEMLSGWSSVYHS